MPGAMPGKDATEPPSVNLSFANNFWGKDDAGVGPLLERLHNAKVTSDELKSFYTARAAIEDEYSRKLLNLSRKPLGSSEAGSLKQSLVVIREEVESMGKAHQSISQQMKTELEEPLAAFSGGLKERRKIVQGGIEKLLKTKMQQTFAVNKSRDRYEQDCLKIKGFLAQAHMVMGQEERKNKARLEKTQIQLSSTSAEYEAAVKVLEETTGRWNRDWKAACDKFQDLEEERIDFTKNSLWTFANISSTVCVSDDAACEKMRLSLEECDVERDITYFIKESGTGQEIQDPPKFINFCRGDADSVSDASEEENYSVAQFQRTMNPAYRASSPQPSMFESHHDPNNPLAKELGLGETHPMPIQDPPQVQPRQPQQQPIQPPQPIQPSQAPQQPRVPQPDPRLVKAQQQARQQYQQSELPHNDYPMDGMTQFCRIGAPSERGANPSPVRPASRDSHSDYSNPTSFSSMEPPSGSASPGKPMAPAPPQPLDESPKKKSGFFQNHSPFRRRSKHEIVVPALASITPKSRSTWGPTSNENPSPTRQSKDGSRGNVFSGDARSASPEPVDPRANFQLNIGNNVFDVASPDVQNQAKVNKEEQEDLDPIAQALEELKGVTKQSSVRQSADRYHGLATPIPPPTPAISGASLPGGMPTPLVNATVNAAQRGAPPPSYDQPPMSRLGAPQPAHTSRAMQQTTQRYINQKADIFSARSSSRPATRGSQQPQRATSPAPPRAISPRPSSYQSQPQRQPPAPAEYRAPSPNPYAASTAGIRPRAQTATSQVKSPYGNPTGRGSYSSTRVASPGQAAVPRAASPQPPQPAYANTRPSSRATQAASPQPAYANTRPVSRAAGPSSQAASPQPAYANTRPISRAAGPPSQAASPQPAYSTTRPVSRAAGPPSRAASPNPQFRQSYDRPNSSRGSDMALQLAPGPASERGDGGSVYGGSVYGGSVYGGSQGGRGGGSQQQQRPQSSYYDSRSEAGFGEGISSQPSTRSRSKSVAEPRQYTQDGRMILHYSRAMYMYNAQIPEELTFAKGDILAVLRLQDDGWWEAEVVGRAGRPGLVPSNYLQNC